MLCIESIRYAQAMRRQGRRKRKESLGLSSVHWRIGDRFMSDRKCWICEGRVGDWEVDLMRCHGAAGYLITAVESRTGYVLIKKVSSKHCDKVMKG